MNDDSARAAPVFRRAEYVAARGPRPSPTMPPVRLTARDQHVAAWIGRWQPVTAMQVAGRFEIARAIAYRRLKALTTLGYLRHVRREHELPGVYLLTELGHDLTGVEP